MSFESIRVPVLSVAIGALLLVSKASAVQTLYQASAVSPPAGELEIYPRSINDQGWILLAATDISGKMRLYLRSPSGDQLLPPAAGYAETDGRRVFGNGRVLGRSANGLLSIPSAWDFAGNVRPLRLLLGDGTGLAMDANGRQQIVGSSANSLSFDDRPVLWQGHVLVPLPLPPGKTYARANAINNAGVIVGAAWTSASVLQEGYVQQADGQVTSIGFLQGGDYSSLELINDYGMAIGMARDGAGRINMIRYQNGTLTDLGGIAGGNYVVASSLNREGVAVGWSTGPATLRAVMTEGNHVVPIDSVLDPVTSAGWKVRIAYSINNRGEILAAGSNPAGQSVACLLTPLTTP